jgi:hypothetical protein
MIVHVFVLLAKELNVGLRVLVAKRKGDEEIVVIYVTVFEKQFKKADETRGIVGSDLDLECISADRTMSRRFAFRFLLARCTSGNEKPVSLL